MQLGGRQPRPSPLQSGVNAKLLKISPKCDSFRSMRRCFISWPGLSFIHPTFSEKINAEMMRIAFIIRSVPNSNYSAATSTEWQPTAVQNQGFQHKRRTFLKYVVNLEMDNSLKWVFFNTVSGKTRSDALWK